MGVKGSKLSRVVSFGRLKGPSLATRKGYIPVAVGVDEETKRFMVHTTAFMSNAQFLQLLCRSAEEYGFCNQGILRIPYDAKAFEDWITTSHVRIQPTTT